ncbi:MAG TPA: selenocysteine-specific translation elongation factor [Chthoniobacterales bacterium]|nr:selenocysteine-specific translation elongation factor [Chthoniobacterales bacterium]
MTNFILATAGHVDHGKSALVKALTGTDPDRLPEEKARGITIDLGFAEVNLDGPSGEKFHVGIVDVPGHEDFVRNMIAGVGSIDLALLVVATDDGWMPQTEEHLQILSYLGVQRIVIALTKSDLGKIDNAISQIREKLRETTFANAQIIPTSTRTGEGIEKLKSALASEFVALPSPRDIGKPRLFVDRAFTLHGIGTVVTGTLSGGQFHRGQNVVIQPQNLSARIRSIQSHGRDLEFAQPGTRTAVNLPDLVLRSDVNRGDVIAAVAYEPTPTLDVLLTRSPRLQRSTAIKSGTSAYVHHGATRVLAKMIFAETDSLAAGKSAVAQLRLSAPLLAFVGDRLIVRDASEQHTIAGGVVFNIEPNDFRSSQQRALLASRTASPDDVDLAVWTEIARTDVVETSHFLERSRFSEPELATALQRLSNHGEIFLHDTVGAKMRVWLDLRKRAANVVDAAHRTHPERRGIELNQLRTEMSPLSPAAFDALMDDLCRDEFVRSGSTIARKSHRANLPPELKSAADRVHETLAVKPLDPPSRKDFSEDRHLQQALRFLIEQGELVELNSEIVLLRDAAEQMRTAVAQFLSEHGPATASQLRQAIGTSRRVVIPFLEYLDRTGVTQRTGDVRQLRETKSATIARR